MTTPTVFNVRPETAHPTIRARFDVRIGGSLVTHDWMLHVGPNGPWISAKGIPQINGDGFRRTVGGKRQYTRNISFTEEFKAAVLAQLWTEQRRLCPSASLRLTEAPACDPFAMFALGEQLLADVERALVERMPPEGPAVGIRAQVVLALILCHVDKHHLHSSLEPTPPELTLARAIMVMFDRGPLLGTREDWE